MIYRLFCTTVVVFWIVMTGLLVKNSYFADEDRLPEVDAEYVIDKFIENPNRSNLTVYRGKKEIGQVSIYPRKQSDGDIEMRITALSDIKMFGLKEQEIAWRGRILMDPQHLVKEFRVSVKFRDPNVGIFLEIDPKSYEITYRIEQEGELLVDSDDEDSKTVRRLKPLLDLWGLSPKDLKRKEERNRNKAERDRPVARHGKVEIRGETFTAYIIELAPIRGKGVKLYFTNAGELLKVKIGKKEGGYEALSEVFDYEATLHEGGEK